MKNIEADFLSQKYYADPTSILNEIREDQPIFFSSQLNKWVFTRYRDLEELIQQSLLSTNYNGKKFEKLPGLLKWYFKPLRLTLMNALLYVEPPAHTRQKKMATQTFSPSAMRQLQAKVELFSNDLLKQIDITKPVEFMSAYAFPLPIFVICEILGVSVKDRALFRKCSDSISHLIVKAKPDFTDLIKANSAIRRLRSYFNSQDIQKRSGFLEILQNQMNLGNLSHEEYISFCILLLIAGHETTKNMIGNAIWRLSQHDLWDVLRQGDDSLLDSAIEECLRFDTAVPIIKRVATQEFEFQTKKINKGDEVLLALAAANRDPEVFANPEKFDIFRTKNDHLTFGFGRHFCLGSSLTRIEMKIALKHLLSNFREIKVTRDPIWRKALSHHGPEHLYLKLSPL